MATPNDSGWQDVNPQGQTAPTQSGQGVKLSADDTGWQDAQTPAVTAQKTKQQLLPEPEYGSDEWYARKIATSLPEGSLDVANKVLVEPFENLVGGLREGAKTAAGGAVTTVNELAHPDYMRSQLEAHAFAPGKKIIETPEETAAREHPAAMGTAKATAAFVAGVAGDPRNWPLMGAGEALPVLNKLMSVAFAGMLTKDAAEGAKKLAENWDNLSPEERWEIGTETGLGAAMATAATFHATKGAAESANRARVATKEAFKRAVTPEQARPKTIGGTEVLVRPEGFLARKAEERAPEVARQFAQEKTAPAVAGGLSKTIQEAAGLEGEHKMTTEDPYGLASMSEEKAKEYQVPVQRIDSLSENAFSNAQMARERVASDFSKAGKEEWKKQSQILTQLWDTHRSQLEAEGIDVDVAKKAWGQKASLDIIEKAMRKTTELSADPSRPYDVKLGKTLGTTIKNLLQHDEAPFQKLFGSKYAETKPVLEDFARTLNEQSQISGTQATPFDSLLKKFSQRIVTDAVGGGIGGLVAGPFGAFAGAGAMDFVTNKLADITAKWYLTKILTTPKALDLVNTSLKLGGDPALVGKQLQTIVHNSDPSWTDKLSQNLSDIYHRLIKGEAGEAGAPGTVFEPYEIENLKKMGMSDKDIDDLEKGQRTPISSRLRAKYGTTTDPLKAGIIMPSGDMIPLVGEHESMMRAVGHNEMRDDLIRDENVIRTRYRTTKAGKEVVFSIPDKITEEQAQQMRAAVGKMGPTGNLAIEQGKKGGTFYTKEMPLVSDVNEGLKQLGAIEDVNAKAIEDFHAKVQAAQAEKNPFNILGQEKPMVNPEPAEPRAPVERTQVQGGEFAEPKVSYHEASQGKDNPWVRRSVDPANDSMPTNEKRTLLVQFASELLNKTELNDPASQYYDKLYSGLRSGYSRMHDFWEIPQWIGFASHFLPDADVYVVRDMAQAKEFLNSAKYGHVAFSALDMNKSFIKELAQGYDGTFDVGGYIKPEELNDVGNIRWHGNMESFAKEHGVEYKKGVDYRHFTGSDMIPRLTLSDGCLHKCAFCIVPKKVTMTPDNVVRQQADSIASLGSKLTYINDKTFGQAPNYKTLPELYKQVKEKNPDFQGFIVQTTAAQMNKLTPEFLKESGIKFVELGVETYNDALLKELHKPATESIIDKAVDKLRQAGVALIPNIIIGLPGESADTYQHTLNFIRKNEDVISHANIYNLALYKDAELGQKLTTASEGDFNENVLEKSFHTNPEVHRAFAGELYGLASRLVGRPDNPLFPADGDAVIANNHNQNEGSSFHVVQGDMTGKDGYAVSVYPEVEKIIPGTTLTPEEIKAYREQPKVSAILKSDPEAMVGTWVHDGKSYIDLSIFEPNKDRALAIGMKNGQKAIFDLKNKGEISVPKPPSGAEPAVTMLNASGESEASLEAQHRTQSEQAKGLQVFDVDTRMAGSKDAWHPVMATVSRADQVAQPYHSIVEIDKDGNVTVRDEGKNARPLPNSQRIQELIGMAMPETPAVVAHPTASPEKAYRASLTKNEIATRNPKSAGTSTTNDPSRLSGLDALNEADRMSPPRTTQEGKTVLGVKQKMAAALADYKDNGISYKLDPANADEAINTYIDHAKENLKWLYNATPKAIVDAAGKWYESAHDMTKDIAKNNGVAHEQVAAVTAALSPKNDWNNNIAQAKRLVEHFKNNQNHAWTPKMSNAVSDIQSSEAVRPALKRMLEDLRGKRYNQLKAKDPDALMAKKAMWFRILDEAHGPSDAPVHSPTGQVIGSQTMNWGQVEPIAKALSILEDGSVENINRVMGQGHKIRNFYNNIINPWSERGHVTVDTHAIGALHLKPYGQDDIEATHNFGGGQRTGTPSPARHAGNGISGSYSVHEEAYRRAAAELGLQPRQLQSITWEGIRSLMGDEKKTAELRRAVNTIWQAHESGQIPIDRAREEIVKAAGGFTKPNWMTDEEWERNTTEAGDTSFNPEGGQ